MEDFERYIISSANKDFRPLNDLNRFVEFIKTNGGDKSNIVCLTGEDLIKKAKTEHPEISFWIVKEKNDEDNAYEVKELE